MYRISYGIGFSREIINPVRKKQLKFYRRLEKFVRAPVVREFNNIRQQAKNQLENANEKQTRKITNDAIKKATELLLENHHALREWTKGNRNPSDPTSDETTESSNDKMPAEIDISKYQREDLWTEQEVSKHYVTSQGRRNMPQDRIKQIVNNQDNKILNHIMIEVMLEMLTTWRMRGLKQERKPTYLINPEGSEVMYAEEIRKDYQLFLQEYRDKGQLEYPFMKIKEVEKQEEISRIENTSQVTSESSTSRNQFTSESNNPRELGTPRNNWRTVQGMKSGELKDSGINYSTGSDGSSYKRPRGNYQKERQPELYQNEGQRDRNHPRGNPNDRQYYPRNNPIDQQDYHRNQAFFGGNPGNFYQQGHDQRDQKRSSRDQEGIERGNRELNQRSTFDHEDRVQRRLPMDNVTKPTRDENTGKIMETAEVPKKNPESNIGESVIQANNDGAEKQAGGGPGVNTNQQQGSNGAPGCDETGNNQPTKRQRQGGSLLARLIDTGIATFEVDNNESLWTQLIAKFNSPQHLGTGNPNPIIMEMDLRNSRFISENLSANGELVKERLYPQVLMYETGGTEDLIMNSDMIDEWKMDYQRHRGEYRILSRSFMQTVINTTLGLDDQLVKSLGEQLAIYFNIQYEGLNPILLVYNNQVNIEESINIINSGELLGDHIPQSAQEVTIQRTRARNMRTRRIRLPIHQGYTRVAIEQLVDYIQLITIFMDHQYPVQPEESVASEAVPAEQFCIFPNEVVKIIKYYTERMVAFNNLCTYTMPLRAGADPDDDDHDDQPPAPPNGQVMRAHREPINEGATSPEQFNPRPPPIPPLRVAETANQVLPITVPSVRENKSTSVQGRESPRGLGTFRTIKEMYDSFVNNKQWVLYYGVSAEDDLEFFKRFVETWEWVLFYQSQKEKGQWNVEPRLSLKQELDSFIFLISGGNYRESRALIPKIFHRERIDSILSESMMKLVIEYMGLQEVQAVPGHTSINIKHHDAYEDIWFQFKDDVRYVFKYDPTTAASNKHLVPSILSDVLSQPKNDVVVKGYQPKSTNYYYPANYKEVQQIIPTRFSGENKKVMSYDGQDISKPSIPIERYLVMVKRACEQVSIPAERFAKMLYDLQIFEKSALNSMEELKAMNISSFQMREEGGTYVAGERNATTYDWRVAIAELEKDIILRLRMSVDKGLIMNRIKIFKINNKENGVPDIRGYSEMVLKEYVKGGDSPVELFRAFDEAFNQLDRRLIDGEQQRHLKKDHYRADFLQRCKDLQHNPSFRDDIAKVCRQVCVNMQTSEDDVYERLAVARLSKISGVTGNLGKDDSKNELERNTEINKGKGQNEYYKDRNHQGNYKSSGKPFKKSVRVNTAPTSDTEEDTDSSNETENTQEEQSDGSVNAKSAKSIVFPVDEKTKNTVTNLSMKMGLTDTNQRRFDADLEDIKLKVATIWAEKEEQSRETNNFSNYDEQAYDDYVYINYGGISNSNGGPYNNPNYQNNNHNNGYNRTNNNMNNNNYQTRPNFNNYNNNGGATNNQRPFNNFPPKCQQCGTRINEDGHEYNKPCPYFTLETNELDKKKLMEMSSTNAEKVRQIVENTAFYGAIGKGIRETSMEASKAKSREVVNQIMAEIGQDRAK